MDSPSVYIPIDRRQAIAKGKTLPERTTGSAIFADISGFTPLTEALALELGARRGAEELTVHLNRVYDALINELHRYGGSVIGFSGDAITCWMDGDDGLRATASALAMQNAMERFSEVKTHSGRIVSLGMKAAVATGSVRRFLVGNPDYVIVDVMAGKTLENLAAAEHQAERGDVILDNATAMTLEPHVIISEWRVDEENGERFGLVSQLKTKVPESRWPSGKKTTPTADQSRGWVLPPVYDRLHKGQGEFLAELRPAVALFLRFSGIDYDNDPEAPTKLNEFIVKVQDILMRYEGSLIQLTIGDKGSYLYSAFGAPIAHEEDAERAAATALELQTLPSQLEFLDELQIGVTTGRMRTGAYGSETRRTYGVLGDAVNLSARLMSAAKPGQILVSDEAHGAIGDRFSWERLPEIKVKGKSQPVSLWRLAGYRKRTTGHLQEPKFNLPMVGRKKELKFIEGLLDDALLKNGQIIGLTAEAGMGKSRLAAEVIQVANDKEFAGYAGECQSYGTTTSYLVWQSIWRGLLGINSDIFLEDQIQEIEDFIREINPELIPRIPLLSAVLNVPIPDNDLTSSLEAKIRKSSLEGMLVDILEHITQSKPLLLLLEDCHWLDPLSHDLIEVIGRSLFNLPIIMLLVYRPPEADRIQAPRVSNLPYFKKIELKEFTNEEAQTLIHLKLIQFFGKDTEISTSLVKQITTRAAGNPYYIEELLNFIRDKGLDPHDIAALENLDLPSSLYSLILTRMDQLTERQNATVRVASVIGRLFPAAMIWGVYPEVGSPDEIKTELQVLNDLDLTPLETPEPELTYLFKHIIIQEVAYESLLYATRAMLHEHIGLFIETHNRDSLAGYINLLAHHFERSENEPKKREYFLKAAKSAQLNYANDAAIDYYQKVIPLLSTSGKLTAYQELGQVLELVGNWDEAANVYQEALNLANRTHNLKSKAHYQASMAWLSGKQGFYDEAESWLAESKSGFEDIDDDAGLAQTLGIEGIVSTQRGDFDKAQNMWEESLAIRRHLNEQARVAALLSNLGIIARMNGDYPKARSLHEEALEIRRELGDRWAIANSLNNLGNVALDQGDKIEARKRLEEAVTLQREVGDRWMIGNSLNNLGNVARSQGDYDTAMTLYQESLLIYRGFGDKRALAYLFEDIGWLATLQGADEKALHLVGAASTLREEIGSPLTATEAQKLDEALDSAKHNLGQAAQLALSEGQKMALNEAILIALNEENE